MTTVSKENVTKKIEDLHAKIDTLYAVQSIIDDVNNYLYDSEFVTDDEGNWIKDLDGNYITKIRDCEKNKIVDEILEFLAKKYL